VHRELMPKIISKVTIMKNYTEERGLDFKLCFDAEKGTFETRPVPHAFHAPDHGKATAKGDVVELLPRRTVAVGTVAAVSGVKKKRARRAGQE
jgi:hypothetical protein